MREPTMKVLEFPISSLGVVQDLVREADIVLGHDTQTGEHLVFYGLDLYQEIKQSGRTEGVKVIMFTLDLEGSECEELAFALILLKGSCCLPNAQEAFEASLAAQPVPLYDPATDK